ncbi:unnamed protein product [Linum trigynum]|uniref:DYW domain-containing protein n=1 Tax=Linum trigynum TaxID=586398 RepID=A0AAV2DHR9_9ROSI
MNFCLLRYLRRKSLHRRSSLASNPFYLSLPSISIPKVVNFSHTATAISQYPQKFTSFPPGLSLSSISERCSRLLSLCTASKSLAPAMEVHTHLIKFGLHQDARLRNLVVNVYSKCRCFGYARKLLDESPEPDLVSWSALISGYSQNGLGREAISAFREMHSLGVKCNEFAFPSVFKACTLTNDFGLGMQVHATVVVTGFENEEFVLNSMVVLYAKCGEIADSARIFDAIPRRTVVSWNALLNCYVQRDSFGEAVELFQDMIVTQTRPNEFTLSAMINACTGLEDGRHGRKIHGYLIKLGYDLDLFSANALVDMYAKLGSLKDSLSVFNGTAKPDIVSWNAVIAGCVLLESHDCALELFRQMNNESGISPNTFTLSSALKACAGAGNRELGRQLHAYLIRRDLGSDAFLGVGLVDLYSKSGYMVDARLVFNLIPEKDLISWNAVISGHSQNGEDVEAVSLFPLMYGEGVGVNRTTLSTVLKSTASLQANWICRQIHALSLKSGFESDNYIVNSFIDAYGKCGRTEDASKVFRESQTSDLLAFTSMITAYSQDGQGEEALKLYLEMQSQGIKPDAFVYSSLLNACASLSAYEQAKQVHVQVLKLGFITDIFAGNSLVNSYAKCGSIDDAERAFREIPERSIVSWSAMIGGMAQHGHGRLALQLFDQMLKDGIAPNHITLVSVLCACNHAGLVSDAKRYFSSMEELFGVRPMEEHYACMIDILGRAGKLDEAMELVDTMPYEANAAVWGALLGAARIHKNVDLGSKAAEMLINVEPEKSGTHILLANIYASAGMWDGVAKVRKVMKDSNVKKEPGMSWMEIKDKVHAFIVGDRSHPRSKEIYDKLEELSEPLRKAGYVPMVETDLHDVEEREKAKLLYHHSEKLAVAFGLIATPPGAPIRVKKNLRICLDCHTAIKLVSKIASREIIVRDVSRFHHFKDGLCSCGDYW